ncbi:MAG: hypothetical protein OXC53_02400, partial [Rhodobacteraceae bacterium]|nr:hypothetical protein [Paracoccaceae bacterium]
MRIFSHAASRCCLTGGTLAFVTAVTAVASENAISQDRDENIQGEERSHATVVVQQPGVRSYTGEWQYGLQDG